MKMGSGSKIDSGSEDLTRGKTQTVENWELNQEHANTRWNKEIEQDQACRDQRSDPALKETLEQKIGLVDSEIERSSRGQKQTSG
jgi:hypothetical protein